MNIRTILQIIGIALILAKILDQPPVSEWSWLWVTAPIWAPFALGMGLLFGWLSVHLPLYKFNENYRRSYNLRKASEDVIKGDKS